MSQREQTLPNSNLVGLLFWSYWKAAVTSKSAINITVWDGSKINTCEILQEQGLPDGYSSCSFRAHSVQVSFFLAKLLKKIRHKVLRYKVKDALDTLRLFCEASGRCNYNCRSVMFIYQMPMNFIADQLIAATTALMYAIAVDCILEEIIHLSGNSNDWCVARAPNCCGHCR